MILDVDLNKCPGEHMTFSDKHYECGGKFLTKIKVVRS